MMEMLILLAIALSALLVIGQVARNLGHAGDSPFLAWLGRLFVCSPDRGNWWWTDRQLARIPELAPLDRRERRQLHIDAWQSWKTDHQWLHWGSAIMVGACIGIAQPWVEGLCEWLMVLMRPWPVVDRMPAGLLRISCASAIYYLMFMVALSFTGREVNGRLLGMARRWVGN